MRAFTVVAFIAAAFAATTTIVLALPVESAAPEPAQPVQPLPPALQASNCYQDCSRTCVANLDNCNLGCSNVPINKLRGVCLTRCGSTNTVCGRNCEMSCLSQVNN
ncbi:hypothetical protein GQ42DRAFT_151884 [Ramicandelaber brevisporus]|nr:hypothetical protein GQ42DRAFT_151884 [Ramicandelaber brevisporus]